MGIHALRQPILLVKKYVAPIHGPILEEWLKEREMDLNIIHQLPRFGWIVFDEEEALAAGFLRLMEGNFGMIDGLISKPFHGLGNRRRSEALDWIVEAILEKAEQLELKKVLAFSHDSSTLKRSLKYKFVRQADTMMVREG